MKLSTRSEATATDMNEDSKGALGNVKLNQKHCLVVMF